MAGSALSAPKEMRFRWYRQVEQYGKTVDEVCGIFGISRKTYYKWYRRDYGLEPGVRKPRKTHPHLKITGGLYKIIVEAKEKYNYGSKKMSVYLLQEHGIEVSPSAIYKFYKKRRLIRKPQKKQKWYTPMKEPVKTCIPGHNIQLDVKYVPGPGVTWNYQYRFIDQASNIQFAVDMDRRRAEDSIRALKLAEKALPFPIDGIQTDNGGEFRGVFHEYLLEHGITHRFIPKRSAPWNGKVERANRSVDDEYYLNPTRPWKTIKEYTHWYNHKRPHLGYGMHGMTPYEKYYSLTSS